MLRGLRRRVAHQTPASQPQRSREGVIVLALTIVVLLAMGAVVQLSRGRSVVGGENPGTYFLDLLFSPLRSRPHMSAAINVHQYADKPASVLQWEIKQGHVSRVEVRTMPAPLNIPSRGPHLDLFVYRHTGMDLDLMNPTVTAVTDLLRVVRR